MTDPVQLPYIYYGVDSSSLKRLEVEGDPDLLLLHPLTRQTFRTEGVTTSGLSLRS